MVFLSGWKSSEPTVILLYSILFFIDMLVNASAVVNIFSPGAIMWIFGLKSLSSRTVGIARTEILTFRMMNKLYQHSVTYYYLI